MSLGEYKSIRPGSLASLFSSSTASLSLGGVGLGPAHNFLLSDADSKVTTTTIAPLKQLQEQFQLSDFLQMFVATYSPDVLIQHQGPAADKLTEIVEVAKNTLSLLDSLKPSDSQVLKDVESLKTQTDDLLKNLNRDEERLSNDITAIRQQQEKMGPGIDVRLQQLKNEIGNFHQFLSQNLATSQVTKVLPLRSSIALQIIQEQGKRIQDNKEELKKLRYALVQIKLNMTAAEMHLEMIRDVAALNKLIKENDGLLKQMIKKLDAIKKFLTPSTHTTAPIISITSKSIKDREGELRTIMSEFEVVIESYKLPRKYFNQLDIREVMQNWDDAIDGEVQELNKRLNQSHEDNCKAIREKWNLSILTLLTVQNKICLIKLFLLEKMIKVTSCEENEEDNEYKVIESRLKKVIKDEENKAVHNEAYNLALNEFRSLNDDIKKQMEHIQQYPVATEVFADTIFKALLQGAELQIPSLKTSQEKNYNHFQHFIAQIKRVYLTDYYKAVESVEYLLGIMKTALNTKKDYKDKDFRSAYSYGVTSLARWYLGKSPTLEESKGGAGSAAMSLT